MAVMTMKITDELQSESREICAEVLFASPLQPSQSPSNELVRASVTETMRRLGVRACVAAFAAEFGEHPECAVTRMRWARAAVRRAYDVPESVR